MPLPLKPGYNFNYDHITRPPHYEMATAEAYTDFYGISYMVHGERLIYSPTFTTIVQTGEMVFIPRNIYRRTTYLSNEPYERILLKFTDSMVADLFAVIGEKSYQELCDEHIIRFEKNTQTKILSILNEMEQEWNIYNDYSELLLKGLLNKLIITCLRERITNNTHSPSASKTHDHLMNAIRYIHTHLCDNPSLEETAQNLHVSSSYLSKIFTNLLHTPFSVFVLNEKIAYARKLLVDSDLNIAEISVQSGFSSNAYFSDSFKRITGLPPLQFRKKYRGQ